MRGGPSSHEPRSRLYRVPQAPARLRPSALSMVEPARATAGAMAPMFGCGVDLRQPRMVSDHPHRHPVPRTRSHADGVSRLPPLYRARLWQPSCGLALYRCAWESQSEGKLRHQRRCCRALSPAPARGGRWRTRGHRAFHRHERHDRQLADRERRAHFDRRRIGAAERVQHRADRLAVDRPLTKLAHARSATRSGAHLLL